MGQNLSLFDEINNILFSDSKENINNSYDLFILGEIEINSIYLRLDAALDNLRCKQFVIKKNNYISFTHIKIKLKDIKLKMIENKNYLEIKEYIIINNEEIIDIGKLNFVEFQLPEINNNLNNTENEKIISKIIKVKETDLMTSYSYEFSDIYSDNISIELTDELKNKLENNKIYLFNGFKYCGNHLKLINISSIDILDIDYNIMKISFPKNFEELKNGEIINIQGKIKDISLSKLSVLIEEINFKKNFEIYLNINLIRKIHQNNICTFTNFKKNNNVFIFTNLSDIYSFEETIIEIYFLDFEQRYYNKIKVNNDSFNINQNVIKFNIDSTNKNEIFEQKFIYEKTEDNEIINSYEFILEVNKGKKNCFCSFLKEKGKHSYQIYFQSNDKNNLPEDINVKMNEKESIKINIFDNYDNNLRKRITIINAIEQDLFKKLKNMKENKIKDNKNLKFYFILNNKKINNDFDIGKAENEIINEKYNSSYYIFEYDNNKIEKKNFFIAHEKEIEINELFHDFFILQNDSMYNIKENLLNRLFSLCSNDTITDYFEQGFQKYIFRNSKHDYENIKKFILLYSIFKSHYSYSLNKFYTELIRNILLKMKEANYLEKIQVLLYIYFLMSREYSDREIHCIDIYNKNNNEKNNLYYSSCLEAFNLFFDIIDKQEEHFPFYQTILQFNGIIKTDLIRNKQIYSGNIISLLDIKFNIIKKINRFFFIYNCYDKKLDGEFFPNSNIIVFYPKYFISNDDNGDILTININKKIKTAILFLIFNFDLFEGYIKTSNYEEIPKNNLNNDLNLIFSNFKKINTGFLYEYIPNNNLMNLKLIEQINSIEDLFDINYYIKSNFDELIKKLEQISKDVFDYNKKIEKEIEEEKNNLKGLPEYLINKLIEVGKNLDDYNYNRLYPIFKIPDNMTEEQFKEILKNNKVYKKFMKIISKGGKY